MNEYILVTGELCHYGVKGMKWGVRRDARILANHRRNVSVRKAKERYERGKITKERRAMEIREANAIKKETLNNYKKQFKNAKNDAERERLGRNITKQALAEVPDIKVKRGLAVVTQTLGAVGIGKTAVQTLGFAVANPTLATGAAATFAAVTAVRVGMSAVQRMIQDKAS